MAWPEFEELEGHVLVICNALNGLCTSGLCWHECFADCLWAKGFTPSKAEPDIWLCCSDDKYEYIAIYVDDLAIAARNPKQIVEILMYRCKFKLKGTGPIAFHLGMDLFSNEHGVLCMAPRQYMEKMCDNLECMFGCPPKQVVTSPI